MSTNKTADIPLIGPLVRTLFGARNERFVKRYTSRAEAIGALGPELAKLTDDELRAKTEEFRGRVENGESTGSLLVEAFAVAREAMDRAVGIRNVFNPEHADAFAVDQLSAEDRATYDDIRAKLETMEPAAPEGEYLGCAEPVPAWRFVEIPPSFYEAVRAIYPESRPPFRARPFDVQLIGAMVLFQGKIAEMKTGEGKTIVAPLACYLAALEKMQSHVVTVNDYLVQRDRDWTFPFFHALGLTVGAIHPSHMQPEDMKRQMYECDVVYGTTSEFGFDYLRDNMKRSVDQQVQRTREFAVVDEVDSILIDEARTPLIISGPAHEDQPRYDLANQLAKHLVDKQTAWNSADEKVRAAERRIKGLEGDIRNARDKAAVAPLQQEMEELKKQLPQLEAERDMHPQYYEVELDRKSAHVTHLGTQEAQKAAGIGSFYVGEDVDLPHLLQQAVRAHAVYQRDKDYVVMPIDDAQSGRKEPSVVIVDPFTGRLQIGRQWSEGLHQAIECKEGVPIKKETQTVASITIQNFFKLYKRLAGMTGTADTEAQEFHDIYKLDVVVIPTNRPMVRGDHNDVIFLSEKDKWDAIVEEIKAFNDVGRPVLVGTTSVESSEKLSAMLQKKHNVKHEVLNAKQHEREANIVENAGALGAVMIATNMAGRGTDIKLQRFTREDLLDHWKRRGIAPADLTTDASDEELREKVFRKVAPKTLGIGKDEAKSMAFDELELMLLRHWAKQSTFVDDKRIDRLDAETLKEELDAGGRFLLHRLHWVENAEELGGLHVVGTERHESRRIDNQLRGRSGRQGDKGSSRFFISLEDDLMKMFAGETTMKILSRLGMKEGDSIEHPMLSKSVERAQRKVEERNFHGRKQLLEYDEVMEHQRQSFYGLRQRSLEGRRLRELLFEYIEDSARDAAERFLAPDYPAECIAEALRMELDISIEPERLRGRELDEVERRIRLDAKDEAKAMIAVTIGEYLPDADVPAGEDDTDYSHLAGWAKREFGVEFTPEQLRTLSKRDMENTLLDAAEAKIDAADLTIVQKYLVEDYGLSRLEGWCRDRYGIELENGAIKGAETPVDAQAEAVRQIVEKVRALYREREIDTPVEFAIGMTMQLMGQGAVEQAGAGLARWANTRYDLGWENDAIQKRSPEDAKKELRDASEKFVDSNRVEEIAAEAQAIEDREELDAFFRERFNAPPMPRWSRRLKGDEFKAAVRARVEAVTRGEMVQFERAILLDVLDNAWRDHLYAMDQIRATIGFRSYSQLDPRIEYKREGTQEFERMQESVRDRVTDLLLKVRMAPQGGAPARRPSATPPQQRPPASSMPMGGSITGPGFA